MGGVGGWMVGWMGGCVCVCGLYVYSLIVWKGTLW